MNIKLNNSIKYLTFIFAFVGYYSITLNSNVFAKTGSPESQKVAVPVQECDYDRYGYPYNCYPVRYICDLDSYGYPYNCYPDGRNRQPQINVPQDPSSLPECTNSPVQQACRP